MIVLGTEKVYDCLASVKHFLAPLHWVTLQKYLCVHPGVKQKMTDCPRDDTIVCRCEQLSLNPSVGNSYSCGWGNREGVSAESSKISPETS